MEQKTRIHAEEGKQELVITRVFDLPVELVYRAYSEIELIEEWMGTSVKKLDHKNLGSYHFETSHNVQVVFKAKGTIHEVVPNEKIVRTFEMENSKIGVQLEFLEFEKLTDGSSKLSIQIIYRSDQHRDEQLKLPFAFGLNMAHDRLNELRTNKTNAQ
jgi:uncharacterized protein YndB with AHSA1/START domain